MTVIDDLLKKEGSPTNDSLDKGGPTAFGISKVSNPEAWKNGPPTEAQARAIYEAKYVNGPGFNKVQDKQLREQLIDYGVNSGPAIAIRKLQEILKVPTDGILGNETLVMLSRVHPEDINNLLVASRVKMIGRLVQNNPLQVKFLSGWLDRALQFLI